MAKLLILTPDAFNCYSKFERKVKKITQEIDVTLVMAPRDAQGLVTQFFGATDKVVLSVGDDGMLDEATHAIVFDDGEEFVAERAQLQQAGIPFRWIKIAITRVINIKKSPEFKAVQSNEAYEYIGRGSYWGNPHSQYEKGESREEVIRLYRYDFEYDKFINIDKSKVYALAGKRLGCFCKPAACHGDVLADFLNRWDDGK